MKKTAKIHKKTGVYNLNGTGHLQWPGQTSHVKKIGGLENHVVNQGGGGGARWDIFFSGEMFRLRAGITPHPTPIHNLFPCPRSGNCHPSLPWSTGTCCVKTYHWGAGGRSWAGMLTREIRDRRKGPNPPSPQHTYNQDRASTYPWTGHFKRGGQVRHIRVGYGASTLPLLVVQQ